MFGTKFVGAVHGRMLTASAAGAMVGPTLMTLLVRGRPQALDPLYLWTYLMTGTPPLILWTARLCRAKGHGGPGITRRRSKLSRCLWRDERLFTAGGHGLGLGWEDQWLVAPPCVLIRPSMLLFLP